jgi:hypothetical protein
MTDDAPSFSPALPPAIPVPPAQLDIDDVEDVQERIAAALRDQQRAYLDAVDAQVLTPLRDAVTAAQSAHADAQALLAVPTNDQGPRAASEANGETDAAEAPLSQKAAWSRVRRYRQAVSDGVWEPLRTVLHTTDVGAVLSNRWAELMAAREGLSGAVPTTMTRPEPDALYAPDDEDTTWTRVRKTAVRTGRRLSAVVQEAPARTQSVPMAALVEHHVAVCLPDMQGPTFTAIEQKIARWVGAIERTAERWTHVVLEAERLLDAPAFHHDAARPHAERAEASHNASGPDQTTAGEAPVAGPTVDPERLLGQIRDEAEALADSLAEGRALHLDDEAAALAAAARDAAEALRADVDRADSALARRRPAVPPRRQRRQAERRRAQVGAWPAWYRQAVQRLLMLDALCSLRTTTLHAQEALVADVAAASLDPLTDLLATTRTTLSALHDDADALLQAPDEGEARALLVALNQFVERTTAAVEETLLAPLRDHPFRRAMQDAVEARVEALKAVVAPEPATFTVHPLVDPDEAHVSPTDEPHAIEWQAAVRDALNVLLFDAWRAAVPALTQAVDRASAQAEEVSIVVQFNLNAAAEELRTFTAQRSPRAPSAPKAPVASIEGTRELALGGLQRAIDALADGAAAVDTARPAFADATWAASSQAWIRLHQRARAAGRAREQVLRVQSLLTRAIRDAGTSAQQTVRSATLRLQRALQAGQRRAGALLRLGQTAVGAGPVDASVLQETIEALATVDVVLDDLPLVYRHLFSFRPVANPSLLVAREEDLLVVERYVERWRRGLASSLLLTGAQGSGRTSLLNVLRTTTFRTARRHQLDLTERVTSETNFATQVARTLGLRFDATATPTLDAVSRRLRDAPSPDRLRVCTIEHLEHTFLSTMDGTGLTRRVLTFFAETDAQVLWVTTMSAAAWQIIQAYEPSAARLVAQHALSDIDRQELESLILRRHQRSGLRLAFEAPDELANPFLTRRLRTAASDERRQEILRTDFFDRLFSLCGQNVTLALFYWFRAVRLDEDKATLRVQPLRPVSFDYLDALSLPQAFALKALLEHATLTIEELADVLQVPVAESQALLTALGNALLIAPTDAASLLEGSRFTTAEPGIRYRIRPLVNHPVTRFLRSRNIVH